MAETNKIVVDVEINSKGTGAVTQSLKELKAELKAAQSAALNGDGKAAKRVAELKDKMEDLKDTTKSMQGSGVEKVSNSFGLLGQGFKDMDLNKIKTGFKGVGAAMSAIPIFLIVEGIMYLIQNFDKLSKGNGVLAKVLRVVGDLFSWVGDKITEFTDFLGLSNSTLDKFGDSIKTNADKGKEALNEQTAEFDRQMKVAKAAGKSTIELEQAKQQAIIDTNLAVAKQIEAFVRAGGELDDEKKKLLTASLDAIKDAKINQYVIEQEDTNRKKEEYKKQSEAKKKQLADDFQSAYEAGIKEQDRQNKEIEAQKLIQLKQDEDRKKLLTSMRDQEIAEEKRVNAEKVADWAKADANKLAISKQRMAEEFAVEQNLTQSLANLSDTVFAIRSMKAKKGSAEEEKIARNQFKVNKALQLATATINGYQAISTILAQYPKFDGGIAMTAALIAAGAASAATIAKISATQFQSSGGGDTSAPSLPSASGGASTPSPNTQAPTTQAQPFTRLDEGGNNLSIKAYVVESEMTDKQNRVNRLKEQASF